MLDSDIDVESLIPLINLMFLSSHKGRDRGISKKHYLEHKRSTQNSLVRAIASLLDSDSKNRSLKIKSKLAQNDSLKTALKLEDSSIKKKGFRLKEADFKRLHSKDKIDMQNMVNINRLLSKLVKSESSENKILLMLLKTFKEFADNEKKSSLYNLKMKAKEISTLDDMLDTQKKSLEVSTKLKLGELSTLESILNTQIKSAKASLYIVDKLSDLVEAVKSLEFEDSKSRYFIKLFTGSLTDEDLVELGFEELKAEELNRFSEAFLVKSSDGEIERGLSNILLDFINTMGYTHNR